MAETRLTWAGMLLGIALGGFFDGILLHQILQWHHLFSGLNDGPFGDLRFQVLMDGLFHVAMYLFAAIGLVLLWQARETQGAGMDRRFAGALLLGFGTWHLLDAVLSHWILGIHRILQSAASPLLWDLGWALVFGAVPVALGWWLRRPATLGPPSSPRRGAALPLILAIITVGAGLVAALPPPGATTVFPGGCLAWTIGV